MAAAVDANVVARAAAAPIVLGDDVPRLIARDDEEESDDEDDEEEPALEDEPVNENNGQAPAAAVDADVVDEPEVEAAVAVPGDDEPIEAPGAGDAAVGGGVDEGELMINYLALRYISLS